MESGDPSAQWARVRELVERALELAPTERNELLADIERDDRALAAEVRSLLELEASEDPFTPADSDGLVAEGLAGSAAPGDTRVGPYLLRRELGSGGMGRVFLGVRDDGEFHQQVAIKRLRVELADGGSTERFRRERQVLANLQHPGIARLLDGGVDDHGAPYLVMEYVDGLSIDRYCDEGRLSVRERIRLFRRVCEAVHHAHQNLVVHRDIKPQNVLVTPSGEVKLCDFGIAKILDPEKSSAAPELTAPLQRLLTPAYASPEHLRGLPITTSADVYSLGVLLYELLTGRPPYQLTSRSAAEIERTVCEQEPEAPSTAIVHATESPRADGEDNTPSAQLAQLAQLRSTTLRALRREISGDLDRIVLQALRKEPHRRYASAEQLGADLERFLRGEPVLARPDTALYRTARFLGRHRGSVTAAAAALMLLLAGLVVTIVQYRRADQFAAELAQERDREQERARELEAISVRLEEQKELAETRLSEVEQLNVDLGSARAKAEERLVELTDLALRLVFDVHREIYALEGATRATEMVLRTGLEKLELLGEEVEDDPALLRRLSGGHLRLGGVQGNDEAANLGQQEEAWKSYERALELARAAVALAPDDPANAFALASALLDRGRALEQNGRIAEALQTFRAGRDVCEALPENVRWSTEGLLYLGQTMCISAAQLQLANGEIDAAEEELDRASELLDRLAARGINPAVIVHELSHIRLSRARVLSARGEFGEAMEQCWTALDEVERNIQREPNNVIRRYALIATRAGTAALLAEQGDFESALELRLRSEPELVALANADPDDQRGSLELIAHYRELAELHDQREDLDAALASRERALEYSERVLEPNPDNARKIFWYASALVELGKVKRRLGRLLEAIDHGQQARRDLEAIIEREPSASHYRLGCVAAQVLLADTHRAMAQSAPDAAGAQDLERAREWLRLALASLDEIEQRSLVVRDLEQRRAGLRRDLAEVESALGLVE